MQRLLALALTAVLCSVVNAAEEVPARPDQGELASTRQQASYAIGVQIAHELRMEGLDIDVAALAKGLADVFARTEPKLTPEQCREAVTAFHAELREQRHALGEKNKIAGNAFLAANARKPNIVSTSSGLQYEVLRSGTGPQPRLTDRVKTHYHGTLIDNSVFDSSVDAGEPVSFDVGGVIRGWTEALQLMHVGDKWKLYIPSELAYGPRGQGLDIGPHAVLVFELELLAIE